MSLTAYTDRAILGIIQGLTEFIPISSSGHLVLAKRVFTSVREPDVQYVVLLHLATLVAVVVYYFRDLVSIIQSIFTPRPENVPYRQLAWSIILATGITGVVGILAKHKIEAYFNEPRLVGFCLLFTALNLVLSDRIKPPANPAPAVSFRSAVMVGVAQSIALLPGVSRSGMTITWGLFSGLDRQAATRFSFLLSLPAILGAAVLELKDVPMETLLATESLGPYLVGMVLAATFGYATIHVLVRLIGGSRLWPLGLYCTVVGILAITFL